MTDLPIRPSNGHVRHGSYTREEIERGLVAVALCSGSARGAARLLKDHGQPIPRGTLQRWSSDLHADRYAQVREDVMPRLKAMMAEEHTALARQQMSVANKLLARLEAEADELPVRDLPGAIRNIDVGSGIHTDKARDLRGDPSMIVRKETRDVRELLEEIHRKFPGIVHVNQALIEGTAEEDTDA